MTAALVLLAFTVGYVVRGWATRHQRRHQRWQLDLARAQRDDLIALYTTPPLEGTSK